MVHYDFLYFDGKTQFSLIFLGFLFFYFYLFIYLLLFFFGGGGGGGGGSGGQSTASFTCGPYYGHTFHCEADLHMHCNRPVFCVFFASSFINVKRQQTITYVVHGSEVTTLTRQHTSNRLVHSSEITLLRVMYDHMRLQIAFNIEPPVTNGTLERPCTSMDPLMIDHVISSGKNLATDVAGVHVRFLRVKCFSVTFRIWYLFIRG